jgi:hypothetical protein
MRFALRADRLAAHELGVASVLKDLERSGETMLASIEEQRDHINQGGDEANTLAVLCGVPALAQAAARKLEREGFRYDPDAAIVIVLDAPPGFALYTLETIQARPQRLILVTASPCAEYWEDLWDLHPNVLLAGGSLDLSTTVRRAARGEQYRDVPATMLRLTPAERRMLRLLARG